MVQLAFNNMFSKNLSVEFFLWIIVKTGVFKNIVKFYKMINFKLMLMINECNA